MKRTLLTIMAAACGSAAQAAIVFDTMENAEIPYDSGFLSSMHVESVADTITNLRVSFDVSGIPDGSLYVDVRHGVHLVQLSPSAQATSLSVFLEPTPGGGQNLAGDWFLYVANKGSDVPGATLKSWTLEMNFSTVPEPGTWIAGLTCLAMIGLSVLSRKETSED